MKALLSHLRVAFPRTHDLRTLRDVLAGAGRVAPESVQGIGELAAYAVEFRYDDIPPSPDSKSGMAWMDEHVEIVREWVETIMQETLPKQ